MHLLHDWTNHPSLDDLAHSGKPRRSRSVLISYRFSTIIVRIHRLCLLNMYLLNEFSPDNRFMSPSLNIRSHMVLQNTFITTFTIQ